MAGPPTIRDVARAAGVSVGTVSRVLNGHKSVSPVIQKKVVSQFERLNYQPDIVARSMRLGMTRTVACAIRDISIPGFGDFVSAAEQTLRQHGYTLLLACTGEERTREVELLRLFEQRRVDGVIMTISSEQDRPLASLLKIARMPIILLDRERPRTSDAVLIDHRMGMRQAFDHLLELGHSRIALLTGNPAARPARARIEGMESSLAAAGVQLDPELLRVGSFSPEFGEREVTSLLKLALPPTAVVCGGMGMLPGVLRALGAAGLRVPQDMSVIAGADSDLAALAVPGFTSIRWDMSEVGRLTVELLLDRLQGGAKAARRKTVATEFMKRYSCAPPKAARG